MKLRKFLATALAVCALGTSAIMPAKILIMMILRETWTCILRQKTKKTIYSILL